MSSPPKKYVCGYCARAFTRSEHKQRHERSHTNEKPFHCSYCTSAFVRRDLLQRHCRTVHNIRLVSRAHPRDPRFSKAGSALCLEKHWKPASDAKSPTISQPNVAADCTSPTSNALHQVSPNISPKVQSAVTSKAYSILSPQKVSPISPGARSSSLEFQTSPTMDTEGPTSQGLHAHQCTAHAAANPLTARRSSSPTLDTESNIVASAKALLQLAPKNTPTDVLQMATKNTPGVLQMASKNTPGDLQMPPKNTPGDLQMASKNTPGDVLQISPGGGLGTPFDPSFASSSLDILQILSLAKLFEQYYFPEDLKHPLNEFFYVGYSIIAKKPYNTLPTSHSEVQSYNSIFSQGQPHTFKVGLAYIILAVGCLSLAGKHAQNEKLATDFIDKARDSLIEKSVSSQNTPANQLKLLSCLYLLTNVCISHFNTDSTLAVLEDTTHSTIQSLPQHLMDAEMDLLWKIYTLVSELKHCGKPPKFYTWFLGQKLNGSVLAEMMRGFSTPRPSDFPLAGTMAHVVISTISNEMNSFTTEKVLWIYPSRLELHSALGYINKLVSKGPNSDLFEMLRRKLLIEAPAQCKDLLEASLFEITNASQINLLFSTLRELDVTLDFHQFLQRNLKSSFQTFVEDARGFFESEDNYSPRLSSNFGLVSFPLIFNESLLGLKMAPSLVSQLSLNTFEKSNLDMFVLQWYATFVKTLVKAVANNHAVPVNQAFSKNVVFQSLLTILKERGRDNFETSSHSIIPILEEVTRVCDSWLQHKFHLSVFQQNLFHFCRELLILTLNQGKFNMNDVYASNDSLLVRNHRSKSIGSIESALHPIESHPVLPFYQGPPVSSPTYSHNAFTRNYVLMGDTSKAFPISPAQNGTAQYSPLGVTTAMMPGKGFQKMEIPTILPPIHASLRSSGQVQYDNLKSSE